MTDEPTITQAADQDGYDGGYLARQGDLEAWGETEAIAMMALMKLILQQPKK